MNIEKHRAFINSLECEKGLPEEMHGWMFDAPWQDFSTSGTLGHLITREQLLNSVEYLIERIRRAESRQIPDLKEKVKELVRDAMDAENDYISGDNSPYRNEFRALCEQTKPEVKP